MKEEAIKKVKREKEEKLISLSSFLLCPLFFYRYIHIHDISLLICIAIGLGKNAVNMLVCECEYVCVFLILFPDL